MQARRAQEDSRERACSRACAQPSISLWLASGSSLANAATLAFSLSWPFQRRAGAAVSSAPCTTGIVPSSTAAVRAGVASCASSSISGTASSSSSCSDGAAPQAAAQWSAATVM